VGHRSGRQVFWWAEPIGRYDETKLEGVEDTLIE
jgi:hypothetical protein